mgnify:CR=1 FL=1
MILALREHMAMGFSRQWASGYTTPQRKPLLHGIRGLAITEYITREDVVDLIEYRRWRE